MYSNRKISIIIPCYNEEESIGTVLKSTPHFIDEIIVVDNNSTDRTSEIVKKFKNVILEKELRQGYGAAIKKGIIKSQGDVIVVMDGDGQHSTEDVQRLIDRLIEEDLDFVWGSRFPAKLGEITFSRIIGNKAQTFLFNLLFGAQIKDSQSGMIVFRKDRLFNKININNLSNGMAFSEEIKARAVLFSLRWGEHKITIKKRKGASKLNPIVDGLKNIARLFKLFYELRNRKNQ